MTGKALAGIVTGLLLIILMCVGGISISAGGIAMAACADPQTITSSSTPGSAATTLLSPSGGRWTSAQLANAAIIVAEGNRLHVPPRGWVIAVAVAMQESDLTNLGNLGAANDHDSLGLFQQRPSQGWGTPAQILDPHYAATQFYQHLTAVPGWQDLPLTVAGQRVQISAYPEAYAKWEGDAVAVVNTVGPTATNMAGTDFTAWIGMCAALGADGQPDGNSTSLPAGFTFPAATPPAVVTALTWALAQLGTPYAFGGDCTAAHSGNPARQCDCASLVQQAYRAAGITLPRTTFDQVNTGTPVIDYSHLLPGDLLFIPGSDGTPSHPGHVGLYLGNGLLINAPHTGANVSLAKIASWRGELAQVRRVVAPRL